MRLILHSRSASGRGIRHVLKATVGLGLLLGATEAQAQSMFGLGTVSQAIMPGANPLLPNGAPAGAQGLFGINPADGQLTGTGVAITGIGAGQKLVGTDYRPNTGQLFALGYNAAAASPAVNAQLYVLDPATGALTAVGAATRLELGGATARIGFDFNPTVDRIRIVSTNDANYRVNPNNGAIVDFDPNTAGTQPDLNLNYADGTPADPNIGAVAYTNSYRASSNTTLYDFDEVAGILATQNLPNNGTLVDEKTVMFGPVGIGSPAAIDMDISFFTTPGTNEAFVMEVTQANANGLSASNLYVLNLATGQATLRGNTVGAFASSAINIEDISVSIPAPAALAAVTGQLVYGVTASNNLISFDSGNPGVIRTVMGISGLPATQILVGTDFRPNTGQLFGLGYNASAAAGVDNSQLYTIDLNTGAATAVGAALRLELGGTTEQIAFDFNPTVDRIRVEGTTDANYRLNPNNGTVVDFDPNTAGTQPDGTLAYGAGTGSGQNPNVGSVAYVNSFVGSTATGLYTLDHALGLVSLQNPPNDGVLTNQRSLTGVNGAGVGGPIGAINDLDVYYNGTTNVPYLAAAASATPNNSRLFTLNPLSPTDNSAQVATDGGAIGLGISVRDISVPLSAASTVAVAPGAVTGQLLYGLAGGNLISFDSDNPSVIRSSVNFGGGIIAGQTVVGVDFRPADGRLYALGYNPALASPTANAQLYSVDLGTGVLTAVPGSAPIRLDLGAGTTQVGFDFNPTVDRIRVVATNNANYRLNPNNGTIVDGDPNTAGTQPDTNLNGQAGTYSATAYTNNQSSANTTMQFVFDSNSGQYFQVTNPNGGVVGNVGTTVTAGGVTTGADFDIFNTPGTTTNVGFIATAASTATANDNLYTINGIGSAATVSNAGLIGQGSNLTGLSAFISAATGLTWNGSVSTDWGTAANWTPAQVPAANSDVTIPSGTPNQPTVSNAQQARLVTIASGATLTLANGGILTTGGNFTNNGTVTGGGTGTLVLGGTATVVGGTGLSTFPNLTTGPNAASTAGRVAVQSALTLNAAFTIGTGQMFTLLSTPTNTAYVVQNTGGSLVGAATVQRAIDATLNGGPGYRHYSSPVAGSTVADLGTTGFTPLLNDAYNTSATPRTVTPFPTVYGYNQSRLATANNDLIAFDKGWFSPTAATEALVVGRGYTVNIGAGELVDFVGTVNNGDLTQTLDRNAGATAADAGWHLLGNPYPAPLDYSRVAAADRAGLDAAIYVYSSTSQYVGRYRSYANGIGGNPVLPVGQGFFARVSAGQTSGSLTFRNSQRLTTNTATTFQRTTADTRPQVELELRAASGLADNFYAYAEANATPAFDNQLDAAKLTNPTGLNLSSAAASGERLAIDGRAAFTAATVLPLNVGVPAAGTYTLSALALNNLPTGLDAYLRDAQTGQSVNLRTQPGYAFSVTAAQASALLVGRFSLSFAASTALATAPAITAAQVQLYPNPAHARFTVLMPGVVGATAVQAELVNALGQVVRRQSAALPASGATLTVETGELAAGVYTLRLLAGPTTVAKRVVLQ